MGEAVAASLCGGEDGGATARWLVRRVGEARQCWRSRALTILIMLAQCTSERTTQKYSGTDQDCCGEPYVQCCTHLPPIAVRLTVASAPPA